ncbi:alpha/beta hydrolase [Limosilactobacillus fastidiosus]|uniref:Alpha/beta hydrolase n=1 Tax=Limosilactobacillus fastidiosus TaxID=2759855 RepID=A0A7W3YCE6_9LACO|nr:alpha/beta hydrolase [Limosilactobacillus fastidiosus]MBB1062980.1 alpha/beta hydrolase [Limosilactobacillus fastidiosus]MBB1086223.1 alpha/beta hydrolase [Limosilactobacillus fastidiosus]MCD7084543.1 alpha/beta hydrolase [Limosilactobacillus fastidiosus]MCD7086504.1 alpha/beta hydrolase [Limosilactobacillus fastidiosus]MCD7114945.1 alpha/beta hydrolase [Limosilactobacillus fastidiosus]
MKYSVQNLTAVNDTRVFTVNSAIKVKNVRFQNRYGFIVAGHLYLPTAFNADQKYAAIVISGPFGAVKEQSSGLYAQTLAEQGFVTLAFDQSTTGESSGDVRNVASPDIFVEDFSAAVDFMGTQSFVDRGRIGAIGICGLGSHVLTDASIDVRIKAVATSVMYDMAESMWDGLNHSKNEEERGREKEYLAAIRWEDVDNDTHVRGFHELAFDENGKPVRGKTMFPDQLPTGADPVTTEFYNYYVKRAYHPRAINSNTNLWDATTPWGYYNFPLQQQIEKIDAPKLIVTGENAHSRYMAEAAYQRLTNPKELVLVPGATHTDLYDQMDKIPFAKFTEFFKTNL